MAKHIHKIKPSNPAGPGDSGTVMGTIYFGDPSQACGGSGICHLSLYNQGDALNPGELLVDLSTDSGNTQLIININVNQLAVLKAFRADIHQRLMGNAFSPSPTALPYFIDTQVCAALWPNPPAPGAYIAAPPGEGAPVLWPVTGDELSGITLNIAVAFGSPQILPPTVAVNQSNIMIGGWTITEDQYGNLTFSNGTNSITFGAIAGMGTDCGCGSDNA